jgi:hypothetical protein
LIVSSLDEKGFVARDSQSTSEWRSSFAADNDIFIFELILPPQGCPIFFYGASTRSEAASAAS